MTNPERLWRVRRQGASMEARLVDAPAGGVAVQYFQDGRLLVAAPFATRADAQADADARLKELLLAGWATHW